MVFRNAGVCLILVPMIAAAAPGEGPAAQKHGRPPKGHLARVQTGLDVLEAQKFAPLRGKRIGLITNHTGVDTQERSTVKVLAHAPGVQLVRCSARNTASRDMPTTMCPVRGRFYRIAGLQPVW